MPSFEEQYFDVLYGIEAAVIGTFAAHPNAKDRHADTALSGLIRLYNAGVKGKRPPRLKLNETEQAFFDALKAICEGYMSGVGDAGYTVDEIILCLKRIKRSVGQMMKVGGLDGNKYLTFTRDYHNQTE